MSVWGEKKIIHYQVVSGVLKELVDRDLGFRIMLILQIKSQVFLAVKLQLSSWHSACATYPICKGGLLWKSKTFEKHNSLSHPGLSEMNPDCLHCSAYCSLPFMPAAPSASDSAFLWCSVSLGEEQHFESILHLGHMGAKAAERASWSASLTLL